MRYLHLKTIWREFVNAWHLQLFRMEARRAGVKLEIGKDVRLCECHIVCYNGAYRCSLIIANGADFCGANFTYFGANSCIRMGGGKINAGKRMVASFKCGADSQIIVEDGFLFSNSIDLCTTDFHPVYDESGNRINPNKDIVIEKNCWIGRKVYIGKGVHLPQGTIVGAYAVVTKSFDENNTMIAGNPAVTKKRNIYWKN